MILDRLKKRFNQFVEEDKQSQSSNIAGKFLSKAGNFIKSEYDDIIKYAEPITNAQSHSEQMDQQILEVLIEENRQLKQIMEKTSTEMEELKEKQEMLKSLEEEASEENEILKYKVLSLEGQASFEGKKNSQSKIVDELKHSKKQLLKELDNLKQEIKGLKIAFDRQSTDIEEADQDPKLILDKLKMLYSMHKINLNEHDQAKILTSLFLRDQKEYRHFRERLFQQIAQKAVDCCEFQYKSQNPQSDGQNIQQQSRLFIENKKLKNQNQSLKQQLKKHEQQISQVQQSLSDQQRNFTQKQKQQQQKFNNLLSNTKYLKDQLRILKDETYEQIDFISQYIQPNLQLIQPKLYSFNDSQQQKVKDANKAVYEKNKQISELFMKNTQLEQQQKDTTQNNKIVYEKNKQIGDLFNKCKQLEQDLEEYRKMNEQIQQENQDLKYKLQSVDKQNQGGAKELSQKNEKLQKEVDDLNQQIKQMKHEEVVKSLMKSGDQAGKEVEEARKSVMEKNKVISEMFNKQNELNRIIEERDEEINQLRMTNQGKQDNNFISSSQNKNVSNDDFFGGFFNQIQKSFWGDEKPTQHQQNQQQMQIPDRSRREIVTDNEDLQEGLYFRKSSSQEEKKQKEIVKKVVEESEKHNTDSPKKILQLELNQKKEISPQKPQQKQQIKDNQEFKSFKYPLPQQQQKKEESPLNKKNDFEDDFFSTFQPMQKQTQNKNQVKQQEKQKESNNEIEIPKPQVSLDFLDNMFTGLVGNTISQDMKKEEESKVEQQHKNSGWGNDELDLDLDQDLKLDNQDNFNDSQETPKMQAQSKEDQFGWEKEQEISFEQIQQNNQTQNQTLQKSMTFNRIPDNIESQQNVQTPQSNGWQDEVDIEVDDLLEQDNQLNTQETPQQQNQQHQQVQLQKAFSFSNIDPNNINFKVMGNQQKAEQQNLNTISEEEKDHEQQESPDKEQTPLGWDINDDIEFEDILERKTQSLPQVQEKDTKEQLQPMFSFSNLQQQEIVQLQEEEYTQDYEKQNTVEKEQEQIENEEEQLQSNENEKEQSENAYQANEYQYQYNVMVPKMSYQQQEDDGWGTLDIEVDEQINKDITSDQHNEEDKTNQIDQQVEQVQEQNNNDQQSDEQKHEEQISVSNDQIQKDFEQKDGHQQIIKQIENDDIVENQQIEEIQEGWQDDEIQLEDELVEDKQENQDNHDQNIFTGKQQTTLQYQVQTHPQPSDTNHSLQNSPQLLLTPHQKDTHLHHHNIEDKDIQSEKLHQNETPLPNYSININSEIEQSKQVQQTEQLKTELGDDQEKDNLSLPDDELSQSPKSQKLPNLEYLSQNVHYSIQTQGQNDTPSIQNELTSEIIREKQNNESEDIQNEDIETIQEERGIEQEECQQIDEQEVEQEQEDEDISNNGEAQNDQHFDNEQQQPEQQNHEENKKQEVIVTEGWEGDEIDIDLELDDLDINNDTINERGGITEEHKQVEEEKQQTENIQQTDKNTIEPGWDDDDIIDI